MRLLTFLKTAGPELSGKKLGKLYYLINLLCLLFAVTVFLFALHNIQTIVAYYFNQSTSTNFGSPTELFSRDFIEKRVIVLLEALKYQFWLLSLILLKNCFLFIRKNWSFFISLLITIMIVISTIINYRAILQPDGEPYLSPVVPISLLKCFYLLLLILILSDILIVPITALRLLNIKSSSIIKKKE
ncbi:MAG: hypothetical protein WA584_16775 [Pyrinomonadaceae bacterium]